MQNNIIALSLLLNFISASAMEQELMSAISSKDNTRALSILSRIDINKPLIDDKTPLYIACNSGNFEVANALLARPGIQANVTSTKTLVQRYAIHLACFYCWPEDRTLQLSTVKGLKERGVQLDIFDGYGDTPLHIAVNKSDHPELVEFLVEAGASICKSKIIRGGISTTPLENAVREVKIPFVVSLLKSPTLTRAFVDEAYYICEGHIEGLDRCLAHPVAFTLWPNPERKYTQQELQRFRDKRDNLLEIKELLKAKLKDLA